MTPPSSHPPGSSFPLTFLHTVGAALRYLSRAGAAQGIQAEAKKIWMHACGSLSPAEKKFVPGTYRAAVFRQARAWLCIYAATVGASLYLRTPLPAMYVFLPYSLGAWHFVLTGVFQHASLEHDVLDHRCDSEPLVACHM